MLTDGSCFIALALAKFGQCSKMRNFSVIFGNLSNMRKIEFSEFCQIFNGGINSASKLVTYIKNKGERKKLGSIISKFVDFSKKKPNSSRFASDHTKS